MESELMQILVICWNHSLILPVRFSSHPANEFGKLILFMMQKIIGAGILSLHSKNYLQIRSASEKNGCGSRPKNYKINLCWK